MFNFDALKSKAEELAKNASGKAANFAKNTADKAKTAGRITKLTLENNAENDKIKKVYAEIGKLYFEKMSDAVDPEFIELFNAVNASKAKIAANEAEIAELKAADEAGEVLEEVEAEAETVEEAVEEKVEEKVEETFENVTEAAEDVFTEVKEAVEDVVDEVKDAE